MKSHFFFLLRNFFCRAAHVMMAIVRIPAEFFFPWKRNGTPEDCSHINSRAKAKGSRAELWPYFGYSIHEEWKEKKKKRILRRNWRIQDPFKELKGAEYYKA